MKIHPIHIYIPFLLLFLALSSCSITKQIAPTQKENSISAVNFLSEFVLPNYQVFENTLVGGLSGVDYDVKRNQYFLISDDPSQYSPARIYKAKIDINKNKIDTVLITGVTLIHQENGLQYPKFKFGVNSKADGESVRYNPITNQLLWSNEGERSFRLTDTTLVQPALTFISLDGKFINTIQLPHDYVFSKSLNGLRKNALFEGVTFADNYKTLYASLEEPRYEDSPQAAYQYDKALTRILKFDLATNKNTAQYAYNLDAMPVLPSEENSWNVNGISEILAVNNHTLLVIERSWAKGHDDHTFIKLYLVDLNGAENQINNSSFIKNPPKPLVKKLLFNFDTLNKHIDNFEGVTFGPKLENGNSTLIFCVDNNFSKTQIQQFFLFEVIP